MSGKRQEKRSTQGGERLNLNPFGDLQSAGLPEGKTQKARPVEGLAKGSRVEIRREKAGRGGKTVTTLSAFATHLTQRDLERLLKDLKQSCACGGTLKGRILELQGDVCERVGTELAARGFKPVRAGG
ncbi:MAG: translation initiation factor [Verrucomicrobia bacterium]|nr:translation initiation factor [Verrucomicrobiota bacterium]